jgi:cytochrome c-L
MFAVAAIALSGPTAVLAADAFRNTITGEEMDVLGTAPPEGRDTPAVKKFIETGVNPYNEVKACLPKGEEVYLTSCSGCHGHLGEGKVGPGLADSYWTYPKNTTDKGLFETIFGGAQGMMGPHNDLQLDEILKGMAWIRHLYTGEASTAEWLTPEQQKEFKPYKPPVHADAEAADAAADAAVAKAAEAKAAADATAKTAEDACKISGG